MVTLFQYVRMNVWAMFTMSMVSLAGCIFCTWQASHAEAEAAVARLEVQITLQILERLQDSVDELQTSTAKVEDSTDKVEYLVEGLQEQVEALDDDVQNLNFCEAYDRGWDDADRELDDPYWEWDDNPC